jgi:hypothetical protein
MENMHQNWKRRYGSNLLRLSAVSIKSAQSNCLFDSESNCNMGLWKVDRKRCDGYDFCYIPGLTLRELGIS